MTVYTKRAGVWKKSSDGIGSEHGYVKRNGVWEAGNTRTMYVKRAGAWKGETTQTLVTFTRRYQLTFPGIQAAQASTADSVEQRLQPDPLNPELELIAYDLPGDGTIIIDVAGTQATATAMTNAVKAALEPWSSVTSLGSI